MSRQIWKKRIPLWSDDQDSSTENSPTIQRKDGEQIVKALNESAKGQQGEKSCQQQAGKTSSRSGQGAEQFLRRRQRCSLDGSASNVYPDLLNRNAEQTKCQKVAAFMDRRRAYCSHEWSKGQNQQCQRSQNAAPGRKGDANRAEPGHG